MNKRFVRIGSVWVNLERITHAEEAIVGPRKVYVYFGAAYELDRASLVFEGEEAGELLDYLGDLHVEDVAR